MALNFPLNPADGETYDNYVYDATEGVWNANPRQLASRFITSATQPSTPSNGDGWLDTNTGKTYIYYNDGTSAQWIESGNPVIGFVDPYDQDSTSTGYFSLPKGTSAQRPVAPSNGDIRFNTELGEPEYYSESIGDWFLFRQEATNEFPLEYLVVAGGGGGGGNAAGGGGAGGYRSSITGELSGTLSLSEIPLSLSFDTAYSISVGAGGAGNSADDQGSDGGSSSFSVITAIGGGGGGGAAVRSGRLGGSGGGGAYLSGAGGLGTLNQGFPGGSGAASNVAAGGGGGAGEAGTSGASGNVAGPGGDGIVSNVTGSSVYRAGGGGSGGDGPPVSGGLGGGGATGVSGSVNTGGGGGGGAGSGGDGASGGSGIVIIKYSQSITALVSAGLTHSTSFVGGYKVTQFTAGTGTVTFS